MFKRRERIISFIMAMILTLSSMNIVYGALPNNTNKPGTASSSGTGTVSGNSSDTITTGYKIQLLFLELSDETYKKKNDANGEQLVLSEWNNAKVSEVDTVGTGNVIQRIGEPVYITTQNNKDKGSYVAKNAYRYGDFDYGLGIRAGKTGLERGLYPMDYGSDIANTIEEVGTAMTSLSLTGSNLNAYMSTSKYLPIYIGSAQENSGTSLKDYFMVERSKVSGAEDITDTGVGTYMPTTSYVSLINYIATKKGTNPDEAIYFSTVAVQQGSSYVSKNPEVPNGAVNIYNSGIYHKLKGEYRLLITPYWVVNSSTLGGMTALTARDIVYVADNVDPLGYNANSLIYNQGAYFKDLCETTAIEREDIFGLIAPASWGGSTSQYALKLKNSFYGGGISVFTSEMVWEDPSTPNYIGSISHVFLPGSLNDAQSDIVTASMEYIGPKGDNSNLVDTALQNALIQVFTTFLGKEYTETENVYSSSPLTQTTLLNGTIKLPGLIADKNGTTSLGKTYGYAEKYESDLRQIIDSLAYDDSVKQSVRDIIEDELGLSLDNTSTSDLNLTDMSLAIYMLSRYQLDGIEADGSGWGAYDSAANRWRQILAYQTLLLNEKSKQTIADSQDDGNIKSENKCLI